MLKPSTPKAKPLTPKAPKSKPVKPSSKKAVKSNKENAEDTSGDNMKNPHVVVSWAKPEHFHMTDALLTLIEDSVTWKGTFGFDIGADPDLTPTTKGGKDSKWTLDDIKMLKVVIKNRTTYHALHQELGETGHGLVVDGHNRDLHTGSTAANIWEDIQRKFPWYVRMAALVGGSPNYSRKAVSNSQSALDLSILGTKNLDDEDEAVCHTPTLFEDKDTPDRSSMPPSPSLLVEMDDEDSNDGDVDNKLTLTIPSKRAADSTSVMQSVKKQKTAQDFVREVADAERQARLAMNVTNAKEHTAHEQIKCQSAHDTAIAVEHLRVKAQQEQAAAQHAHELHMMDKQIELARLQHGGYPGPQVGPIDPQLQG
ncbi:hypothetical protein BDN67DRAFT_1015742 [Paxillus ammoniavirescens]|nr:hypothetical protein BDN67DRAFT_1015742 [Paxillus ammoniavirescens]